jgi:hypothetical protein
MLKAGIGIAVLLAGLANAQIPSGNVFLGFSYESTNSSAFNSNLISSTVTRPNLRGWEGSFEGKLFPFIGIVGDVSGHYGTEHFTEASTGGVITTTVSGHEQEYLVGGRLSVPIGKVTPFGEVMVGAAHIHTGGTLPSSANTSLATAVGGGLDFRIFGPIGLRGEGDYIRTKFFNSTQNNLRLSAGIVFHF